MILYVPTSEASELLQLLSIGSQRFNPSWLYDMMEQIREQMPKPTKAVNLSDEIEKQVKMILKEKGV